jgi:NADH:ubiquinone oxidoreductase subunit E
LEILENTIKQKGLEKKVELIGHLCLGSCSVGPAIRIEGVDYYGLEEKQIVDLLQLKLTEKGELA